MPSGSDVAHLLCSNKWPDRGERRPLRPLRPDRRPVRIVGNAPQPGQKPRDPAAGAEKSLLYMGSFMPYKNVETMIQGMAGLPGFTLHLLSRITPRRGPSSSPWSRRVRRSSSTTA